MFFSELSVFPCQFHSTGAPLIVKVGKKLLIFITGVAQEALMLRCVRGICCGALHHATKKNGSVTHAFPSLKFDPLRNTHTHAYIYLFI
jgi:hypothetical protein